RGNVSPAAIIKRGLRRANRIGFDEFPIGIEVERQPLARRKSARRTKPEHAGQKHDASGSPRLSPARHLRRLNRACDHKIKMDVRSACTVCLRLRAARYWTFVLARLNWVRKAF